METTSLREDINKHNINKFYYPSSQKLFRQYQYNIIKTCLQQNTLVCLPTGLGKTLIASIIMYNFIKWFSRSKLFFFAPTKPLVSQQKNSFTSLFPSLTSIITEITGTISRNKRESLYTSKRVFFLTPQTLDNDLTHHIIDTNQIALLIFDEAHKAQKHYAYSNIVQQIYTQSMFHSKLRIIGLSASPGSTIESIQNLVDNLHISKIEFRTERDSDIEQYVFNKQIVIEEVETNTDIEKIQKLLFGLLQQRLDVLVKFNVVQPTKRINVRYLSTFQLLKFQQSFKERKEEFEHKIGRLMIGEIYQTFSLMFQLLHCKKKLLTEGLEAFKEGIKKIDPNCFGNINKYDINKSKSSKKKFASPLPPSPSTNEVFTPFKHTINNNQTYSAAKKNLIQSKEFQAIKKELLKNTCTDITEELGKEEDNSDTKNHNTSNNNSGEKFNINSTHPKLIRLKSILLEHLNSLTDKVSPSKIIIFTEYKDSTSEITNYLNSQNELKAVNFACFTGQNKNFSQKDQIAIMEKFRNNEIQVLIATSVAEEGLDVGEVDLIICYDFSTTSPIKMIQRFGRTGRKRNGKVIVLVTKGEEKSKYFKAINRIKCMYKNLKSINNGSKYNDIHLDEDKYEKMIKIPNKWMEHEERFDLEKEKVEIDLSESEYSNEDSDDDGDNILNDNATQNVVMPKSAKKVNFNFMNNNSKQCDNNNNLFKEKMFSQTTNKLPSKKYASILKTSTKDNIKKSNLNTNNNYDILSFFTHKKEAPKEEETFVHKEITTQQQENKNPNEAHFTKSNTTSKLLLSFKILPAKTDSGSKYKINKSNSCKRLSLKDIQDLNFNINTNNGNSNNIREDKKNENNEPLDLADDIFNQIIEEMIQEDTTNNNNNKNKPTMDDNKENSINNHPTIQSPITEIKQEHASNNLSFELSDDILQIILDNSFQETKNVKSNNETKPLFTKRNYSQYKEDHAIN